MRMPALMRGSWKLCLVGMGVGGEVAGEVESELLGLRYEAPRSMLAVWPPIEWPTMAMRVQSRRVERQGEEEEKSASMVDWASRISVKSWMRDFQKRGGGPRRLKSRASPSTSFSFVVVPVFEESVAVAASLAPRLRVLEERWVGWITAKPWLA